MVWKREKISWKLKDIDRKYLTVLENRDNLEIEEKKRKSQILEKMDEIDIRLKKEKNIMIMNI